MDAVDSARTMITRYGGPVLMQRIRPGVTLTAHPIAFEVPYRLFHPQELAGEVSEGNRQISITDDELAAAGMSPPEQGDRITIFGKPQRVLSVATVRLAGQIVKHDLAVAGE